MAAPQNGTHRMSRHLGLACADLSDETTATWGVSSLPCAPLSDEDIAKSGVSSPVPSPFFSSLAAVWADSRQTAATH